MTVPDLDSVLGFTIAARHVRGRLVRLGSVVDAILAAHAYPPAIEKLLAEALVLTALLGSTLKDAGGQLTIQARTENGAVELLVCDYRGGDLRGYAQFDADRLAEQGADPSLFALFGKGYLAITFDQAGGSGDTGQAAEAGRYQGIVPLEGESLGQAAELYFSQSEQIPSFVRIAVGRRDDGARVAGGIIVQHLPEGEVGRERLHVSHDEPEWTHVRFLAETLRDFELIADDAPMTDIVWRLFHDEGEVRVTPATPLARGCRCDPARIRDVIARFPADQRAEMADESGTIAVDCAFCSRVFPIALASVAP